jgi:hypothetical protein
MNGPGRPWDDMHHLSYFLPELVRIKHDDFRSTLSDIAYHAIVPLDTLNIYVEGNMEVFLLSPQSTSLTFLVKLKMYISVQFVRLKKFRSTPISSNNSMMYSLVHMKRCQESTLALSNMRSKPTWMLNLFRNKLEMLILGRPLLLSYRWINLLMLLLYTRFS